MSMQHTPGPWKVFRVKNGENKGKIIGIGDADAGGVTDPFGGLWRSGKELEANAELIAAAPDLLAALITMRDLRNGTEMTHEDAYDSMFKSGGRDAWQALDAAIAKATGAA